MALKHHNTEHERSLLAALLQDNSLYDSMRPSADWFTEPLHRSVFAAVRSLLDQGAEANIVTVAEATGKAADVAAITSAAGIANADFFAKSLRDLAQRRRLADMARRLSASVESDEPTATIELMEHELSALAGEDGGDIRPIGDLLRSAMAALEERAKTGRMPGLSLGFSSLDRYLRLIPGDLALVAARTSVGKTALALCMAERIRRTVPVGFFTLEMSGRQVAERLLAIRSGANLHVVRRDDFGRLTDAATDLSSTGLWVVDTPNIALAVLKSRARGMVRRGAGILFVDYITLIKHGDARTPRFERVGEVSKQLKHLARQLNVPVVALSQINREGEGQMPSLANLRQSGELEEDADEVLLLHRKRGATEATLRVAKNRNGPTGDVELAFVPESARFIDVWEARKDDSLDDYKSRAAGDLVAG